MTRWKLAWGLGTALALCGSASAQFGPPRPTVSPYINLLRGGSGAVNYYGIVRPLTEQQQYNQQVADQQNQLRQQILLNEPQTPDEPTQEAPYPTTGHPTQVLSYGRYFMNRGSSGQTFTGGGQNFRSGGAGIGAPGANRGGFGGGAGPVGGLGGQNRGVTGLGR